MALCTRHWQKPSGFFCTRRQAHATNSSVMQKKRSPPPLNRDLASDIWGHIIWAQAKTWNLPVWLLTFLEFYSRTTHIPVKCYKYSTIFCPILHWTFYHPHLSFMHITIQLYSFNTCSLWHGFICCFGTKEEFHITCKVCYNVSEHWHLFFH